MKDAKAEGGVTAPGVHALAALLLCLALPSLLVYGAPLLLYELPIAARIGEHVHEFSGAAVGAAAASVALALLIVVGVPALLQTRLMAAPTGPVPGVGDGLRLFTAFGLTGIPASVIHQVLVLSPQFDNLLRIASLLAVAGFGLGAGLLTALRDRPAARRWVVSVMALEFCVHILVPMMLGYLMPLVAFVPVALFLFLRRQESLWRGLVRGLAGLALLGLVLAALQAVKPAYRAWLFGGEFRRADLSVQTESKPMGQPLSCDSVDLLLERVPVSETGRREAVARAISPSEKVAGRAERRLAGALAGGQTVQGLFDLRGEKAPDIRGIGRAYAHDLLAAVALGGIKVDPGTLDQLVRVADTLPAVSAKPIPPGLRLALAYEEGADLPRDLSIAARLHVLLAPAYPQAQTRLGLLLEYGQGVGKDLGLSLACLQGAVRRGDREGWAVLVRRVAELPYHHEARHWATAWARDKGDYEALQALSFFGALTAKGGAKSFGEASAQQQGVGGDYDVNRQRLYAPFAMLDDWTGGVVAQAANRVNQLGNLSVAIREVPRQYEPLGWGVYLPLLTWAIPRVLWSDKPLEVSGLMIGRQLGLAKAGDAPVAWSMPVLVEAWLAGGVWHYAAATLALLVTQLWVIRLGVLQGELGLLTIWTTGLFTLAQGMSSGLAATCAGTLQATIVVFFLTFVFTRYMSFRHATPVSRLRGRNG